MISSAFKSAEVNKVNQQNQTIGTVTSGVKDLATAIGGVAGFMSGATGAIAKAAKYNFAGKIGGVGGAIMLSTMQEKSDNAQSRYLSASDEQLDTAFTNLSNQSTGFGQDVAIDTVWNTIQKERQKKREQDMLSKLNEELGKENK